MILVFKTNVRRRRDVMRLSDELTKRLAHAKWNFDLTDADRIFRVESTGSHPESIRRIFHECGYECEELQ